MRKKWESIFSQARNKWFCPICSIPLEIDWLFQDEFFQEILKSVTDQDVTEVEIYKDATWKIVKNSRENPKPSYFIDLTNPFFDIVCIKEEPKDNFEKVREISRKFHKKFIRLIWMILRIFLRKVLLSKWWKLHWNHRKKFLPFSLIWMLHLKINIC